MRRGLQLIGAFLGLFVLSAATFPEPDPFGQLDLVAPAVTSWVFGAVWMGQGARGGDRPTRAALVLATSAVLLTPLALAGSGSPSGSTTTVIELWIVATSVACLTVVTGWPIVRRRGWRSSGSSWASHVRRRSRRRQTGRFDRPRSWGLAARGVDPGDPLLGAGRARSTDDPSAVPGPPAL